MRIYLNLFGGVAGDMLVAGLLDAGAPEQRLEELLQAMPEGEVAVTWSRSKRQGIAGRCFHVELLETSDHKHRHFRDVLKILEGLPLSPRARRWAVAAFQFLADAEGKAHGCSFTEVHFHEVGAMDAIVDIAAACSLMDALDPSEIFASPIPVGSGEVHCAHGAMPVPAPGTRYLLEGLPTCGFDLRGERATPTGVSLLRAWDADFSVRGAAQCAGVGYGLGSRDPEDRANLLRVELETSALELEWLVELSTLVDDQSGEIIGHALEDLRRRGALDAYAMPAITKKGRPAFEVRLQVEAVRQVEFERRMFRLLGTLGIRAAVLQRTRLARGQREATDSHLTWKTSAAEETGVQQDLKPEFEDLCREAEAQGKTPRELLLALRAEG